MKGLVPQLIRCFKAAFPDLGDEDIRRASISTVAAWDSMADVNLISMIEEEFAIRVAPDDVEQLISFDLILAFLEGRGIAA